MFSTQNKSLKTKLNESKKKKVLSEWPVKKTNRGRREFWVICFFLLFIVRLDTGKPKIDLMCYLGWQSCFCCFLFPLGHVFHRSNSPPCIASNSLACVVSNSLTCVVSNSPTCIVSNSPTVSYRIHRHVSYRFWSHQSNSSSLYYSRIVLMHFRIKVRPFPRFHDLGFVDRNVS